MADGAQPRQSPSTMAVLSTFDGPTVGTKRLLTRFPLKSIGYRSHFDSHHPLQAIRASFKKAPQGAFGVSTPSCA